MSLDIKEACDILDIFTILYKEFKDYDNIVYIAIYDNQVKIKTVKYRFVYIDTNLHLVSFTLYNFNYDDVIEKDFDDIEQLKKELKKILEDKNEYKRII